jgi:hypothetical protein
MAATTTTKATAQLYGASPGTPPKTPATEEHVRPQHIEQELRPEEGPRGPLRGTILASLLGHPQRGAHEGVQQRPCGAEERKGLTT